jgi:hypothetical protein
MHRKLALFTLLVFSLACAPRSVETVPEQAEIPSSTRQLKHPLVTKISEVLPPGWEVTQDGNVIDVIRLAPVSTYNNVALPPFGPGLKRLMTVEANRLNYKITVEIGDLVPKPEHKRLTEINDETARELRVLSYAMDSFRSKADWRPTTESQKKLYEEYREALRSLPYNRLPDLYDDQHSYYVSTTRHSRASFSYQREERECRAVLENLFSFLDGYRDLNAKTGDDESFDFHHDETVAEVFRSSREYDLYLLHKEENLPELRGYP